MTERKFLVSAPQVFCFVFFYLLSGMMLFCKSSFLSALFAAIFSALLCAVCSSVCGKSTSSLQFYNDIFGKCGAFFRYITAFFTALPFCRTLLAFSRSAAEFHGGASARILAPMVALLCLFSVANGFVRAARFCELCVFPLILAMLLSMLGGGAELSFSLNESSVFSAFEVVGSAAAFFSLYLRTVTAKSEKMSPYAKNSSFHPSPLSSGVLAAAASLGIYCYFCLTGTGNILFSLLAWFFALGRLSLFALALSDLIAFPENGRGAQSAFTAAVFCAFWLIFADLFPNIAKIALVFTAICPFSVILFACAAKREKSLTV